MNYRPQTTAGEYARTIGELAPLAALGGAGLAARAGNVAKYAVAPGAAVEATKELAAEGSLPAWAPAAAGVAAGIGAGGLSALAHSRTPGAMVMSAARGMTSSQLDAMEALMRDAKTMGVDLTRAEAAQAVTKGGTGLADLQRIVEGNGGLRDLMAQRPQQVEQAGRAAIDRIAPAPANPSMIGPQVQRAAQGTIQDVQGSINRRTRPLYQAAEQQSMGPAATQALAADPLYARELQAVRNDPALNRTIAQLPDESPVVADLVQRRLRERATNAAVPGQADSSNLAAANYGDAQKTAYRNSGRIA
ncbi:hypothetical protein [Methylocystis sp. S23]